MFKVILLSCCLYFIVLPKFVVNAMTEEQKAQIHEQFAASATECIKEYSISEDDISNLTAKKIADGPNVPCFLACIFKAHGVMDDKGMLEKETVLEHAKKIFSDPEELKLIEDYLHSCSHINKETVNDGDKGCERASLAYKCMIENASQFGLDI